MNGPLVCRTMTYPVPQRGSTEDDIPCPSQRRRRYCRLEYDVVY